MLRRWLQKKNLVKTTTKTLEYWADRFIIPHNWAGVPILIKVKNLVTFWTTEQMNWQQQKTSNNRFVFSRKQQQQQQQQQYPNLWHYHCNHITSAQSTLPTTSSIRLIRWWWSFSYFFFFFFFFTWNIIDRDATCLLKKKKEKKDLMAV